MKTKVLRNKPKFAHAHSVALPANVVSIQTTRAFMKFHGVLLLAVCIVALHGRSIANEVIYQTGFEAPAFTAGLSPHGQDGFLSFALPSGLFTIVSTENPRDGAQCLRWQGGTATNAP